MTPVAKVSQSRSKLTLPPSEYSTDFGQIQAEGARDFVRAFAGVMGAYEDLSVNLGPRFDGFHNSFRKKLSLVIPI
jgi:hypothetical protein